MRRNNKALPGLVIPLVLAAILLVFILYEFPSPRGGSAAESGEEAYALSFSSDFNPALAMKDDLGISVVIAMDVSSSMSDPPASGGLPKYVQASGALMEVVKVLERLSRDSPPGQVIKGGLINFNEAARPVLPLTVLDAGGFAELRAIAADPSRFLPGGNTSIGGAIELGIEWLAQSGTILRSLIVVTDGENTAGLEPATALEAVYANRNSATSEDFPVSTSSNLVSFIGFDIGSSYFQTLSSLGARVGSAQDRAELAGALSSLLEADITKLEAPALDGGGK
jgi:hypothetical protein